VSALDRVVLFVAQGFGLGRAPVAPGTFGTLGGLLLAWGLKVVCPDVWIYASATVALCLVGVALCQRATVLLGSKDPQSVVIDEIAAMVLVFVGAPWGWRNAALGFALFRALDIAKPWPIRNVEKVHGGWGVMLDDLVAGVAAGGLLYGIERMWPS
jgi:phosphatidylglycerophosphatase A